MADMTAVYDALRSAQAAGDKVNAQKLADYIASQSRTPQNFDSDGKGGFVPSNSAAAAALQSPTSGMSTGQLIAAGAGKAPVDLARGIGQMAGLESRADIAASRKQDAALMSSTPAKWGNFFGNVGTMAPAMLIPGVNTLEGAAAAGAISGKLAPYTSTGEHMANTVLGAASGPAGLLLGRGLVAAGQGIKAALWDPFTKAGQSAIAGRVLQEFAGSPEEAQAAAARLATPPTTLPGVLPTTAELANNGGINQLERTLRNNPKLTQDFVSRDQSNRNAMVGAIQAIAGTPQARAAADGARSTLTNPLYDAASSVAVPGDAKLQGLLDTPPMKAAAARAQRLAETNRQPLTIPQTPATVPKVSTQASSILDANGRPITSQVTAQVPGPAPANPTYTGRALQYLNMGLRDELESAPQRGMGAHELRAAQQVRNELGNWIDQNHPQLAAADRAYAKLSAPINRMDIGTEIQNRALPALNDFGTDKFNGGSFANAVSRQGDSIAAKVTGNPNATLAGILKPHELQALQHIGEQFARTANAQTVGRAVGSNTGQNMVAQNVMSQFLGPLGLPQSTMGRVVGSTFANTIGKLGSKIPYAIAEPDVLRQLANAALDPQLAAGLLSGSLKTARPNRFLLSQGVLTPPSVAAGLLGTAQLQSSSSNGR